MNGQTQTQLVPPIGFVIQLDLLTKPEGCFSTSEFSLPGAIP